MILKLAEVWEALIYTHKRYTEFCFYWILSYHCQSRFCRVWSLYNLGRLLPKKEWNSSGSSRSQHQRKTKLPEKTAATCSWSVWASWCVDHRQTFPLPSAGQLHRCPQLLTPARGSGERMWLSLGPELSHHPTHVMAHPCHAPTSRLLRVTKGRVGGWKFHLI